MGLSNAEDWPDLTAHIENGLQTQQGDDFESLLICDERGYHDWDENAGQGQIHYNGSFELLDVCHDCGEVRHTGRYDSVL